jgi:hypothetical protein
MLICIYRKKVRKMDKKEKSKCPCCGCDCKECAKGNCCCEDCKKKKKK